VPWCFNIRVGDNAAGIALAKQWNGRCFTGAAKTHQTVQLSGVMARPSTTRAHSSKSLSTQEGAGGEPTVLLVLSPRRWLSLTQRTEVRIEPCYSTLGVSASGHSIRPGRRRLRVVLRHALRRQAVVRRGERRGVQTPSTDASTAGFGRPDAAEDRSALRADILGGGLRGAVCRGPRMLRPPMQFHHPMRPCSV
jgi:hypothetical protein